MIFFQNFIDFLFCIYYDVLIKDSRSDAAASPYLPGEVKK